MFRQIVLKRFFFNTLFRDMRIKWIMRNAQSHETHANGRKNSWRSRRCDQSEQWSIGLCIFNGIQAKIRVHEMRFNSQPFLSRAMLSFEILHIRVLLLLSCAKNGLFVSMTIHTTTTTKIKSKNHFRKWYMTCLISFIFFFMQHFHVHSIQSYFTFVPFSKTCTLILWNSNESLKIGHQLNSDGFIYRF